MIGQLSQYSPVIGCRPPSPRLLVHARNSAAEAWRLYASTEVAARSSNPAFLVTVTFRAEHNVSLARTQVS